MSLYSVLCPLLFRLAPDRSHALAHTALRVSTPWSRIASAGRTPSAAAIARATALTIRRRRTAPPAQKWPGTGLYPGWGAGLLRGTEVTVTPPPLAGTTGAR